MKRAVVVAAVSLACSASSAAFVHPSAAARTRLKTNSPGVGDASADIPPLARGRTRQQQRRHKHQHRRLGRGRHLTATLSGNTTPPLARVVGPPVSLFLSWAPKAVVAVVALLTAASVVNALQAGVRGDLGLTQEKILGVPAEEATPEHVASLGARVRTVVVLRLGCLIRFQADACCLLTWKYLVSSLELRLLASGTFMYIPRYTTPRWIVPSAFGVPITCVRRSVLLSPIYCHSFDSAKLMKVSSRTPVMYIVCISHVCAHVSYTILSFFREYFAHGSPAGTTRGASTSKKTQLDVNRRRFVVIVKKN